MTAPKMCLAGALHLYSSTLLASVHVETAVPRSLRISTHVVALLHTRCNLHVSMLRITSLHCFNISIVSLLCLASKLYTPIVIIIDLHISKYYYILLCINDTKRIPTFMVEVLSFSVGQEIWTVCSTFLF